MLKGRLTKEEVPEASKALEELERESGQGPITLDLSELTELDSSGVALLSVFFKRMEKLGRKVRLSNPSQAVKDTLNLFPQTKEDEGEAHAGGHDPFVPFFTTQLRTDVVLGHDSRCEGKRSRLQVGC